MQTTFLEEVLSVAPAIFVLLGVWPILKNGHQAKINLSAWAVIVGNAWMAAVGNAFAEQKGASAIYMILNALILTPALVLNINKGAWGGLPPWQKFAAVLLPIGTGMGVLFGGEYATWMSVGVSICLSAQLLEACARRIAREHLLTWTWFFAADGLALYFGWAGADVSLRVLLGVWVIQCLSVIGVEIFNRIQDSRARVEALKKCSEDCGKSRIFRRGSTSVYQV